jgi:hypothetical protein
MQVVSAMQLKKGAKTKENRMGAITQPLQFLPKKEKNQEWAAWNLDWLEWNGIKQIRKKSRRLLKNYKLAQGIIDKSDYIVEENPEYRDIIEYLTQPDDMAMELKFYPIIPNVVNVLVSEFAKRNSRVLYRAVDDYSYNELLEQKRADIEEVLLAEAQSKIIAALMEQGLDPESEEAQEQLNPENLKTLPEIEQFYRKDYKSMYEQWAEHQHKVDQERFRFEELEERGFRDMLITDSEFYHFRMMEDDYDIELWNPVLTFYHKSPSTRYMSDANWVGKTEMITVAQAIDKYGYIMTPEQMEALEAVYPIRSAGYTIGGQQNDGSFYDSSRSHEWNTNMPSLAMRQYTSAVGQSVFNGADPINQVLFQSEDYDNEGTAFLVRETISYWKSQRKLGHLTKIDDIGEVTQEIVTEDYQITDKPVYDTRLFKNKTRDNLVFGEHIDWIWINEVWGGVKLGPNLPSFWGMNNPDGFAPIYLGIDKNKIGSLRFQFKGSENLYGCKIPVEGAVFNDRNTHSMSLVDLMKPHQVAYNLVNNQIADILIDELGTVILLDQNGLPKHSLGEDWGTGNYAKAYVAMKNFQILPLDTSITNTENPLNFQHFQKLDMEQSNRLMSRIQLANYFKQQAFETIGITPQRLGQQISQQDTATGIQQSVNASHAQTEIYFIQHSDYLIPRVHEMRTNLAQYYHSTKPSIRLSYMTTNEEKVNFEMNGTELLMRDFNIFCTTTANMRSVLEQMKQLAINNNTTGASIYDLGRVIQSESIAELNSVMKHAEEKAQQQSQEEQQHQQQLQEQEIQARAAEEKAKRDYEATEKEKDRRKDILVAEIRAAGYAAMQDKDENMQSDYIDYMKDLKETERFNEQANLQREKMNTDSMHKVEKMQIEREKIQAQREVAEKQLQVAKENKNKWDFVDPKTKKKPDDKE